MGDEGRFGSTSGQAGEQQTRDFALAEHTLSGAAISALRCSSGPDARGRSGARLQRTTAARLHGSMTQTPSRAAFIAAARIVAPALSINLTHEFAEMALS